MSHYEVAVYGSTELRDWCESEHGNREEAQERARDYIEAAFGETDENVICIAVDEDIDCPTQEYGESCWANDPCANGSSYYVNLHDWWKSRNECWNTDPPAGADSNILLTNTDESDGGRAGRGGIYSVAQTGSFAASAPTNPVDWGTDLAHSGIDTVLHELGHNLTIGNLAEEYPDTDGPAHRLGNVVYRSPAPDNWSTTPLATKGKQNVCYNYAYNTSDHAWELNWDDCCVQHWRDPNGS